MAEYEDDNEFNSEQVTQIAQNVVENVIGGENIVYQRDKVNQWSQQIIEGIIKDLAKLTNKHFKYVVTCIIQQNIGAGMYSTATAFWDKKSDGLISMQLEHATLSCILTVFCMAI